MKINKQLEIGKVTVTAEYVSKLKKYRPVFRIPQSWDGERFAAWKEENGSKIKKFMSKFSYEG